MIWGAGAIGGTMGAYLARAGHDVTLVDRVAEHVAAINADGLRITGPIAEFTARRPRSRRRRDRRVGDDHPGDEGAAHRGSDAGPAPHLAARSAASSRRRTA